MKYYRKTKVPIIHKIGLFEKLESQLKSRFPIVVINESGF
jgi:hypothetical protein